MMSPRSPMRRRSAPAHGSANVIVPASPRRPIGDAGTSAAGWSQALPERITIGRKAVLFAVAEQTAMMIVRRSLLISIRRPLSVSRSERAEIEADNLGGALAHACAEIVRRDEQSRPRSSMPRRMTWLVAGIVVIGKRCAEAPFPKSSGAPIVHQPLVRAAPPITPDRHNG